MLNPVSTTLQPFRFVSLGQKDRRKLEAIIPLSVYDDIAEPNWMKKLRTASDHRYEPRKWRIRLAAGAVGLITIGLASAIYLRTSKCLSRQGTLMGSNPSLRHVINTRRWPRFQVHLPVLIAAETADSQIAIQES